MTQSPRSPGPIRRLFRFLWRALDFTRRLAFNLLFLFFLLLLLVALLAGEDEEVPDNVALVLSPEGEIVEQLSYVSPAALLLREGVEEEVREETLLRDLTDAIDLARDDARIAVLVLDLEHLQTAGLSKLQEIGGAIRRFRESGKPVIASGDYYTQNQYYLAAHAGEVYLHPMGGILLPGYGIYRTYFKSTLDQLLVQVHAFQVGTYKSALEPFLRDDMSPQAREANMAWLDVLWEAYGNDVAAQRNLPLGAIHEYVDGMAVHLDQVDGDVAQLALTQGLVDSLMTRDQVRQRLIELVGETGGDFRRIRADRYLRLVRPTHELTGLLADRVGVIAACGTILDGKQRPGQIGGDSLAELLRKARRDGKIRAVVLRLDTGGGSAFASEVVRQELLLTRGAGKPVVASLSSVAASGGYWIASAADEVWAAPTTITGSIGIFGAFPTFERSLDAIGVHADGVGTSELAGAFDPRRPLQPAVAAIMQRLVERGYRRFLDVVAQGRDMSPEEVDAVAQGRVWAGATARELGLVDHLGDLQAAIAAAARLADLEEYDVTYVEQEPTPREQLLHLLSSWTGGFFGAIDLPALRLLEAAAGEFAIIAHMNDPQGVYAWCMTCDAR